MPQHAASDLGLDYLQYVHLIRAETVAIYTSDQAETVAIYTSDQGLDCCNIYI